MRRLLSLFFTLALLVIACSKPEPDNPEPTPDTPKQETVTLSPGTNTAPVITTAGGSVNVSFTASAAWSASIINTKADSWCSVSPTSGVAGAASITITVKENTTPDNRSASVVITSGTATQTIKVEQKQKDALTVTASSFEVSADGGEIKVATKSNVSFTHSISTDAQSWIKAVETKALKDSTLTFEIDVNKEVAKRSGQIYLASGDLKDTVNVYQAGETPTIVVSQDEYVLKSEGESFEVEVASNINANVSMVFPQGVDAWIEENTSKSISTNKFYFTAKVNETYDSRSAMIIFSNAENNLADTVTVSQAQKDAIVVAKSSYNVENAGGTIEIEVGHNVDYEYTISADWITKADTKAMVTDKLVFNVAENTSYDNREGTITFTSGSLKQEVKVYQSEKGALIISKTDHVLNSDGGEITLEIQANVEFSVTEPTVDWLHKVTTKGLQTHTLKYTVDPNEGYDSRSTQLQVKNLKTGAEETLTITQTQKDAIVVAKSEYEFDMGGGALDFDIQTNVDVVVTIADSCAAWIQQVETRGLETKKLYFNVLSCDTLKDDRVGYIALSGGSATQTIKILQKGPDKEALKAERDALIAFYKAAGGDNWTNNSNWCSDKPVSEWYGVIVNNQKRVERIILSFNNLSGQSFAGCIDALQPLEKLRELSLDRAFLPGIIPESLGNFKELEILYIDNMGLTGELPMSITNLVNLRYLIMGNPDLGGGSPLNKLTGEISTLQPLIDGKLEILDIRGNSFSGPLPELTDRIRCFDASYNNFSGNVPQSHLKMFEFSEGISESTLYNTEYGGRYDIRYNNLSGNISHMTSHKNWYVQWYSVAPQNDGYGFKDISSLPAFTNTVKCYDGSLLNLGDTYKQNEYTIIFRWLETCSTSYDNRTPIYQLYNRYKDKGLGLVCTTFDYLDSSVRDALTSVMDDVKVFWETTSTVINESEDLYENNPYHLDRTWFYLFRYPVSLSMVVDKAGNIIYLSPFVECPEGPLGCEGAFPTYHRNYNDIYDFVAQLFGEDSFDPGENSSYKSTDYTKDGDVITLQTATEGKGIDLVLMGDGYSDRQIASGLYEQDMINMYSGLFSIEPYKSFKHLFNVYYVTAVSDSEWSGSRQTAFSCWFGEGTHVGGDDQRCFEYAKKAITDNRMSEALIAVSMNSAAYAGTCYMYSPSEGGDYGSGVSISYFPKGANLDVFTQILHHEAGGHGFAKLGDEYRYSYMGTIPSNVVEDHKYSEQYGWWKNVDYTNNPTMVKWAKFLTDTRYQNEGLGVFEGGLTYWSGVWKPTKTSVMLDNQGGFNAPSREAIYYRIHKLAYGADWQYDYEKFVEWDAINRKSEAQTKSMPLVLDPQKDFVPLHPPVVIPHSWREAK